MSHAELIELRSGKSLVELLRDSEIGCPEECLCDEAADKIEKLRAALQQIADAPVPYPNQGLQLIARKALEA